MPKFVPEIRFTTMEKSGSFFKTNSLFKHWPPFVRAYRQNAAGMNPAPGEKKYLQWGTIALVFIMTVIWFIVNLPYFEYQANIGFFTYSNAFVRQFFDSTTGLHISEFLWRFLSQFYLNVPLTALVVGLVVLVFCFTAWKTVGPYTPFLLPMFLLMFSSPEPTHASIAISLFLVMIFLWIYFLLFRFVAKCRGAWPCLLLMHVFAAASSVSLYHATGHWTLVFSIAVVCVHLIGIPMTSSQEKHLRKIRFWDFGISAAIALFAGVFFWKASSYPGFQAPWYVWIALIVFCLACLPGIVLQAYNNQKIYLHEIAKKQGRQQDGKPVLAFPFHLLLTLIATGIGILLFVFAHNASEKAIIKAENAIAKDRYAECLELCDTYFEKYGVLKKHPSEKVMKNRYHLASCLRLGLLMEGDLNNRFLDYSDLHEMGLMYPMPLPFLAGYDYSYVKVYEKLGLFAPMMPQVCSNIELFGMQNRFLEPLLRAQAGTGQVRLMQTYLYYAKKSLYGRRFYPMYRDLANNLSAKGIDGSRPASLQDPDLHASGSFIDQWVKSEVEYKLSKQDSVLPMPLLDYYTFLNLMEKRLDQVQLLARLYRFAGAKNMPRYLQEAVCLQVGYPYKVSRQQLASSRFEGFPISSEAASAVLNVSAVRQGLIQRSISFDEVTRRYSATYTYHFLFVVIR